MNDLDLIDKVKNLNDSLALKELASRHSGLCHQIIKKYYKSIIDFGLDPEEIANDKTYVIYKSALNFDPLKNTKFSTWVGNQMRYHCLNCINKRSNTVNMDETSIKSIIEKRQLCFHNSTNFIKDKSEQIFLILNKMKDSRVIDIFKMRYFQGKKLTPWHIIGKKMGISTQTVINLHNKGKNILKNKLTTKNFIDTI